MQIFLLNVSLEIQTLHHKIKSLKRSYNSPKLYLLNLDSVIRVGGRHLMSLLHALLYGQNYYIFEKFSKLSHFTRIQFPKCSYY